MVEKETNSRMSYKSIFKQFSIYGLFGTLSKAAGLLLLPVYTRYLNPEQYGILELVEVTATIFAMFASAGLGFAVFKFYHRYENQDEKNRVISSAIALSLLFHSALAVFGLLFSRTLSSIIFESPYYRGFLILIFLRIVFEGTVGIGIDYLRVLNRAHLFCLLSLLRLSCSIGLNVFFLVVVGMGIGGILISALVSQLLVGIPLLIYLYRRIGIHFDKSKLVPMFKYGIPFVAVLLGQLTINFADRFFLQRLTTLADVGIYSLGHKFGFMVNFLVLSPFLLMWEGKMFEIEKLSNAREIYSRVLTYLFLALVFVALVITVFIEQILMLMVHKNYQGAAIVAPLIALAFVFNGLQTFFRLGMLIQSKTSIIGTTVVIQSVLSLGIYFVFIRSWGVTGAAWATILSFAGVFFAHYFLSQRLYRIPIELTRVTQVALSATIVWLIHKAMPDLQFVEAVIVKFNLVLLFVLILVTIGFLNEQEKNTLRMMSSTITHKLSQFGSYTVHIRELFR